MYGLVLVVASLEVVDIGQGLTLTRKVGPRTKTYLSLGSFVPLSDEILHECEELYLREHVLQE